MSRHKRRKVVLPTGHKDTAPSGPVIYQVDLAGLHALTGRGKLSNMVETCCSGCGEILLAEGAGFDLALRLAEERGSQVYPVCAKCYRQMTGVSEIPRGLVLGEIHEKEFADLLASLPKPPETQEPPGEK